MRTQLIRLAVIGAVAGFVSACSTYIPSAPPTMAETRATLDEVGGADLPTIQDIVVVPRSDFADRFGGKAKGEYDETKKTVYLPDDWRYGSGLTTLAHELKHYADDVKRVAKNECSASRAGADYAASRAWHETTQQEINYGLMSGCSRQAVDARYAEIPATPAAISADAPERKHVKPSAVARVADNKPVVPADNHAQSLGEEVRPAETVAVEQAPVIRLRPAVVAIGHNTAPVEALSLAGNQKTAAIRSIALEHADADRDLQDRVGATYQIASDIPHNLSSASEMPPAEVMTTTVSDTLKAMPRSSGRWWRAA
jgi:hypothetical protein